MCPASDGKCPCRLIYDNDGATLATWYGDDRGSIPEITIGCPSVEEGLANAKLIVRAVNAHDDLLAMLEQIVDAEFGWGEWPTEAEIRALIAKARTP